MEFSCNQENLKHGLNKVVKIISSRASLPILNNVLLSTDKGRLKISTTDLEIGITSWVGAKIEKEGKITAPAKLLTDYINTNTDNKINIILKDSVLHLESKKYKTNIKGIDAGDFPLIPEIKSKPLVKIKGSDLSRAINQTVFACAHDETRPVLTGTLLKFTGDKLKLVATDSYRLTETIITAGKKIEKTYNAIVPTRTMSELGRIIPTDLNSDVEVYLGENQIMFLLENTQIISRLIEGNYPDYEQIIPKEYKTESIILVDDFTNVIQMASLFTKGNANNVKIRFTPDKIFVAAISPLVGDTTSELDIKTEGEEVEIALNSKFILDILNTIEEESLKFQLNGPTNPIVLKPVKSTKTLYIIMPLKIEE